jgi:hypothetical protein
LSTSALLAGWALVGGFGTAWLCAAAIGAAGNWAGADCAKAAAMVPSSAPSGSANISTDPSTSRDSVRSGRRRIIGFKLDKSLGKARTSVRPKHVQKVPGKSTAEWTGIRPTTVTAGIWRQSASQFGEAALKRGKIQARCLPPVLSTRCFRPGGRGARREWCRRDKAVPASSRARADAARSPPRRRD